MPPNHRRRKIKSDAVGRFLLKEKGAANIGSSRQKQKKAASEFHKLPHMFQEAPKIAEFMSGDHKKGQMQSILERNALDEFLDVSLAAQAEYLSKNAVRVLVKQTDRQGRGAGHTEPDGGFSGLLLGTERVVPIPRRPVNYVSGRPEAAISATELNQLENEAFLKWRLALSTIEEQEGKAMTPFERNLEFWRQLWRVLERSDLVIEILDARNPLFFRSIDLEAYVKEIHPSKEVLLLLNKSDLVPRHVRQQWFSYFRQRGVMCLFFSALEELKRQGVALPEELAEPTSLPGQDQYASAPAPKRPVSVSIDASESADSSSASSAAEAPNLPTADQPSCGRREPEPGPVDPSPIADGSKAEGDEASSLPPPVATPTYATVQELLWAEASERPDVLDGYALIAMLQNIRDIMRRQRNGRTEQRPPQASSGEDAETSATRPPDTSFVVGMVGYPNVGKSSIINALLGHKVVSVSRQPGKTRHFQTLPLPTVGLTLCDCPGLVFPQIVSSKAFLVVNGVSPIDQIRGDYLSPLQVICDMIPERLIRHFNLNPAYIARSSLSKARADDLLLRDADDATIRAALPEGRLPADRFLTLLAVTRGYVSGGKGGLPDVFQTSKLVLRDFTTGKLLHWTFPPKGPPPALSQSCEKNGDASSVPTQSASASRSTLAGQAQAAPSSQMEAIQRQQLGTLPGLQQDPVPPRRTATQKKTEEVAQEDMDAALLRDILMDRTQEKDAPRMTKRKARYLYKQELRGGRQHQA